MGIDEYVDLFNKYLLNLRDKLQKLNEKQKEDNKCGYYPFSPIISRTYSFWVLDFIKLYCNDIFDLEKEFNKTDEYFIKYKKDNKDEYLRNVYCDLKLLIQSYHPNSIVKSSYTFETNVTDRTYIEFFIKELEGNMDITKEKEMVRELDEILKERIKEAVKLKTYFPVDKPFAPREYWWLHLKDVYGTPDEFAD